MCERQYAFGMLDLFEVDPRRPAAESLRERLERHRLVEELGYDLLFVGERHFVPEHLMPAPSVLLAALATATTRMRLGALVWNVSLRHPVLLAEEISLLDHLSGGRIEVGLGLGHVPAELASLGVPLERRVELLREGVDILRRAWQGTPFSHVGGHWRVSDILVPAPTQQPHLPLWYAGTDPAAAVWAAREGFSLGLGFQPDARLAAPAVAFHAAKTPGARLAVARRVHVAESDARARDELIAYHGAAAGVERRAAEALYEQRRAQQVIVAGGPERVAAEVAATLRDLSADVFLVIPYALEEPTVRSALELFARESVPLILRSLANTTASTGAD